MDPPQNNENELPIRTLSITQSARSQIGTFLKESPVSTSNFVRSASQSATFLKESPVSTSNLDQSANHSAIRLKESPISARNLVQSAKTYTTTLLKDPLLSTSNLIQSAKNYTATLLKEPPVFTSNFVHSDLFPKNRTNALSKPSSIDSLNTFSEDRQLSQLVSINEQPVKLELPQLSSPPRLPRYLGNHKSPTVSTLGRSVSLELPGLRAAYLPRRAISLPRITEHSRTALSTRFISNHVAEAHLRGTSIVRQESRGRNPKIAVATPLHIVRARTELHTSTMASVDSAERKEQLMLNFADVGFVAASSLAALPATTALGTPLALGPKEHGRWCRLKAWVTGKRHGLEEEVEDEGEEEGEGAARRRRRQGPYIQ